VASADHVRGAHNRRSVGSIISHGIESIRTMR
jgi:hypothetical protein